MKQYKRYPIGTYGVPWTDAERQQWLRAQTKQRDYFNDIVSPLMRFGPATHGCEVFEYGSLDYVSFGSARFPLYAVRSASWKPELPMVVITGGNHGYEASGAMGAILFLKQHFAAADTAKHSFYGKVNILVLPCMSPWGYEMNHRWTPNAVDPNRQFSPDAKPGCPEASQAMKCIAEHVARSKVLLMHQDLHETTDSDNDTFIPAKFARDGLTEDKWEKWSAIPDGFYVYGDSARPRPQLEFSKAIIAAVEKVTHIAQPDDETGEIVGEKVMSNGVLLAPGEGTADAHTNALYVTTTEVYPDSKRTNPEECNRAQAAAVVAGIEYVMAHQESDESASS